MISLIFSKAFKKLIKWQRKKTKKLASKQLPLSNKKKGVDKLILKMHVPFVGHQLLLGRWGKGNSRIRNHLVATKSGVTSSGMVVGNLLDCEMFISKAFRRPCGNSNISGYIWHKLFVQTVKWSFFRHVIFYQSFYGALLTRLFIFYFKVCSVFQFYFLKRNVSL